MTSPVVEPRAVADRATEHPYWRRNLAVGTAGSFTTLVAMTLLVPFLPEYVRQLGVTDPGAVVRWSGIAYGATFLTAALTAPLWGALGDRFGRKSMLVRASLGMAIAMTLLGFVQSVEQLVAVRLLVGLLGGYSSGATILVAAQTPKGRSAWALGVLSSGILAGNVVGPLVGGFVPAWVGIRPTFVVCGAVIFLAFLATTFLLREPRPEPSAEAVEPVATPRGGVWSRVQRPGAVVALLATSSLLLFATMSIEPIVTVYVEDLGQASHAAGVAGILVALTALGSVVAAPRVGRLADRVGHARVVVACLAAAGVLALAQAFVANVWQLGVLRVLLGLALGGLLPSITAAVKHLAPPEAVGRVLGLGVSAQYVGQVAGPVLGGLVAAQAGLRAVFVATAVVLLAAAALNLVVLRRSSGPRAL
ncbi:MFS transporter [Krasilnikoviella flava]|uniref:Predicted arabinose efflux permease, MFS family n=1 Tax=Krasilnikoviella flava TaxID=526729 RepID=A0A1T5K6F6_9MICO|nr:MFS transporter [Krasilnikoviella flava]SKC59039.1 Predicted arabinose efflux permease, MFS family [Krasilnikoviella flava]